MVNGLLRQAEKRERHAHRDRHTVGKRKVRGKQAVVSGAMRLSACIESSKNRTEKVLLLLES
jgi:hypothetical protein